MAPLLTAECHLAAEMLLEQPQVVAGGQRLVNILAENVLTDHLVAYFRVCLQAN